MFQSLFELRSVMGAAASRVRLARNEIQFLDRIDEKDTKDMLFAKQELHLAEAELSLVQQDFRKALSEADDVGARELHDAASDASFPIAA